MAQITKIETQAKLNSSAEKFYGFFKNNMSSFVHIIPQVFKSFEIVGGGELKSGSVTKWTYNTGSEVLAAKLKIEALDDDNTSIKFVVLDGDLFKDYKSFKSKMQVTNTCGGGSTVKWTFEFEKACSSAPAPAPNPNLYAEMLVNACKSIDAYLGKA